MTQDVRTAGGGAYRRTARSAGVGRELLFSWVHLTALWSFALARPLFAVLEDSPEFFVARGNTSFDIVFLALVVTLVPPTFLLVLEALLVPWWGARRALHLVLVTMLLAAIALQLLEELGLGSAPLLIALSRRSERPVRSPMPAQPSCPRSCRCSRWRRCCFC